VQRRTVGHFLSPALLAGLSLSAIQAQTPVFRATTELQSIAVQAVDGKGNFVPGLTAADFTLLEDGRPQKIAFFGAEQQPASVAILLDSSRSMDYGRKFDRARELLAPLIAGHHPDDQIFFMPFTDRIETFQQLTPEQRQHPERIQTGRRANEGGTALYDALASALCRMRTAQNVKQAVVVITDGADQHSRLNLEQLIELARMSNPQIFMIGFFSRAESEEYREGSKTVTLIGEREIDNPMLVFNRLAKESGAESFFPSSEQDLKTALDRISAMLQAQYTLAYYPLNADRFRKIEVRVHKSGVKVLARRGVGSSSESGPVHFEATTCQVSAQDHPYPWEPRSVRTPSGGLVYHEDFSDPKSGWPNRREQIPAIRRTIRQPQEVGGEYRPGLRYVSGGYEISHHPPAELRSTGPIADGVVAAYGTSWDNLRASVSVRSDWARTISPQGGFLRLAEIASGLVFHLNDEGYYALVLTGGMEKSEAGRSARIIQFKLVRNLFSDDGAGKSVELIPWTPVVPSTQEGAHEISVEYKAGLITVVVDGGRAGSVHDNRLPSGLVGLAVFGTGDATFRDLVVQDLK
jgi:Ca-activated chloride channel homolog